jgi:hypothetical protein
MADTIQLLNEELSELKQGLHQLLQELMTKSTSQTTGDEKQKGCCDTAGWNHRAVCDNRLSLARQLKYMECGATFSDAKWMVMQYYPQNFHADSVISLCVHSPLKDCLDVFQHLADRGKVSIGFGAIESLKKGLAALVDKDPQCHHIIDVTEVWKRANDHRIHRLLWLESHEAERKMLGVDVDAAITDMLRGRVPFTYKWNHHVSNELNPNGIHVQWCQGVTSALCAV